MTVENARKITLSRAFELEKRVHTRFHILVNGDACADHDELSELFRGRSLTKPDVEPAPDIQDCYCRHIQFSNNTHKRQIGVAEAWNQGIEVAFEQECHLLVIMANDVIPEPDCIQNLVAFMAMNKDVDIASGIATNLHDVPDGDDAVSDGCDFSCFIVKRKTIEKHGMFDPNFRVAYFEDNDYCTRVWIAGGQAKIVHAARFTHLKSQTIHHDKKQAGEVGAWFGINQKYFEKKWGGIPPVSPREAREDRFQHPFNDEGKTLDYFPPLEQS